MSKRDVRSIHRSKRKKAVRARENRADERDAAELSRQDRGIGILLKTIAKN